MKSLLHTLSTVVLVICAIGIIGCIGYGCTHTASFDPKEYAKTNHCPYEGLECPNANEVFIKDSIAYANAENIIDSLVNRTQLLETQLVGYELQNHSRISYTKNTQK